jgi:hypothetical protein
VDVAEAAARHVLLGMTWTMVLTCLFLSWTWQGCTIRNRSQPQHVPMTHSLLERPSKEDSWDKAVVVPEQNEETISFTTAQAPSV